MSVTVNRAKVREVLGMDSPPEIRVPIFSHVNDTCFTDPDRPVGEPLMQTATYRLIGKIDDDRLVYEQQMNYTYEVIVIGGANCCSRCRRPITMPGHGGCYEKEQGSGIVVCRTQGSI